jgi:phosphoglucosamine mutase
MCEKVVAEKADLGLSFDGDADRLIACDGEGNVIDGDDIMYICARWMKKNGLLYKDTVVSTVMSNLGFYKALEKEGIQSVKTAVGDRYVVEEMRKGGYNLGGEQSGHIVFLDHNTTGDGLLTALQLLQVIADENKSLSLLASSLKKYPQLLVNVPVKDKRKLADNQAISAAIATAEQTLGGDGRVLVRPSGTEPIVRIMAEGPDREQLEKIVADIKKVVETELA